MCLPSRVSKAFVYIFLYFDEISWILKESFIKYILRYILSRTLAMYRIGECRQHEALQWSDFLNTKKELWRLLQSNSTCLREDVVRHFFSPLRCMSVSRWVTTVNHCYFVIHRFPPGGLRPYNWWLEKDKLYLFLTYSHCYAPYFMLQLDSESGTIWERLNYTKYYYILKNPVSLIGGSIQMKTIRRERQKTFSCATGPSSFSVTISPSIHDRFPRSLPRSVHSQRTPFPAPWAMSDVSSPVLPSWPSQMEATLHSIVFLELVESIELELKTT